LEEPVSQPIWILFQQTQLHAEDLESHHTWTLCPETNPSLVELVSHPTPTVSAGVPSLLARAFLRLEEPSHPQPHLPFLEEQEAKISDSLWKLLIFPNL
jgi:hypothetical protein